MTDLIDTDKLLTYHKRYDLLSNKMTEYLSGIKDATNLTREQFIYHIEILNQVLETQANIASVHVEGLNRYKIQARCDIISIGRIYISICRFSLGG